MDEDYELIRPKPSDPPPLQRLWKSPPEPEAVETVASPKKKKPAGDETSTPQADKPKKKKKKADEEVIDDGTGAIKLEATPVLDTYETRQRIRWALGGVLVFILLIIGLVIKSWVSGGGNEEARDIEQPEIRVPSEARANAEREARILLDMAKQADKNGKTKTALDQLVKLTKTYNGTAAAREALHAIDRARQDKPLFGEDSPTQVAGPKPPLLGVGTAPGPVPPKNTLASNGNPDVARPPTTIPPAPGQPQPPPSVAPPPQPIATNPLPNGYRPRFDQPIHPSGWPTRIISDKDGAEMVLVPGTLFVMGRADGEPQEAPPHEVYVSTYYIDLHEVTVGQYVKFLKDSGRALDPLKVTDNRKPIPDDMPVVNVTSKEALAYCTWAKRRLPTEAQWELAARGPEGRISFWNEELPRKDPEKGDRTMEPVMSLKSDVSYYGAFDMAANAWEWTSEFYDSRYYLQFHDRAVDPTGPKVPPSKPSYQTVKGGSSKGILTWRKGLRLETKEPFVGFRGALPVEGAPVKPAAPPPSTGPNLKGGVQPF